MANRQPEKIWGLLYNMMKSGNTDVPTILHTLEQVLNQKQAYDMRFDHPGIIPRPFVIWLVNQLLNFIGKHFTNRVREQNVQLQKKLMTFCWVHMPILAREIIAQYVKSLKELMDVCYSDGSENKNRPIGAFTCDDIQFFTDIDPDFVFEKVTIPLDMIDVTMQGILQVLDHALELSSNTLTHEMKEALDLVVDMFPQVDIYTKLECLQFGIRFFDNLYELKLHLTSVYVVLFNYCSMLWENVDQWMRMGFIGDSAQCQLVLISLGLMGCSYKTYLNERVSCILVEGLASSCKYILSSIIRAGSGLDGTAMLKTRIIEFLLELDDKRNTINIGIDLLKLGKSEPGVVRLFGRGLLEDNQELKEIMNLMLTDALTNELPDIQMIRNVLITIVDAEHLCINAQQARVYAQTKDVKQIVGHSFRSKIFFQCNGFKAAVEKFLSKIWTLRLTLDELCNYIEVSGLLLQSENLVKLLPPDMHVKLLDLTLYYLRHHLKIKQKFQLNVNSIGFVDEKSIRVSLDSLARIAHQNLNNSTEAYFQKSVKELIYMMYPICHNDAIKVKLNDSLLEFVANSVITMRLVVCHILPTIVKSQLTPEILEKIKSICCLALGNVLIVKHRSDNTIRCEFLCEDCEKPNDATFSTYFDTKTAVFVQSQVENKRFEESAFTFVLDGIGSEALFSHRTGIFAINHFSPLKIENQVLLNSVLEPELVKALLVRTAKGGQYPLLQKVADIVLKQTRVSLKKTKEDQQKSLELITVLSHVEGIPEEWLLNFFKMTFFHLICGESAITNEAMMCATEMCAHYGVEPVQLWLWYKRECLRLIIRLVTETYIQKRQGLTKSLNPLALMLGFQCSQEFVCKYYKIMIAMLLPYCVREERCKGILVHISQCMGNPISQIFTASFLSIYSHIFLYESPEIGNKCIDLLVRCTGSSLSSLMHADVRKTVSEFLIFYNRKPEFVMQAFSCLLLNKSSVEKTKRTQGNSSEDFALFIAERFLGVITYFESCLSDSNFEKSLKEEVLHSLGQIIRLVGAEYVTQSRYKIIAMLTSVISFNDRKLQTIGLKIWNIFLHIVDIQSLGPSLSRIILSLQPLLKINEQEVDAIYKFLILENGNLLGSYMSDLYFIEDMDVSTELKSCVGRQTETLLKSGSFEDLLKFYLKQISNENLQVRIMALKYLREFFVKNRTDLNTFIVGQTELNPLIESVVENLMNGCKHVDRTLQLVSGKCLGELGAIDPSYMSPNYAKEQKRFTLSIHTDTFAITALTELCRAYQKNVKYVDNISVAIQEILAVQGVNPKDNKKINVWEAIPIRMRHIMEPLLSSCYSVAQKGYKLTAHPVFGSGYSRTYEDWAFWWSWRLVEFVREVDTKKLLCSFTPSIRKDNNMLAMFLPYILVHALQECTDEEMDKIFEEFQAIFQQAVSDQSTTANKVAIDTTVNKEIQPTQVLKVPAQSEVKDVHDVGDACAKICFELIDFLYRWVREWTRVNPSPDLVSSSNKDYGRIKCLLDKFDKLQLAQANFNCGEYARALMCLESYIEDDKTNLLQDNLSFLIQIYAELLDPDSVEGAVHMKKTSLTLPEQILVNNIVDRPQENIACYEQIMLHPELLQQEHILGIINSYLRLDLPETVLNITSGLWEKLSERYTDDFFKECQAEPLLRLGFYDDIEALLEDPVVSKNAGNWNVQCAKAVRIFRNQTITFDSFQTELDDIRVNVLNTLKTLGAEHNLYHKAYTEILKLQLLTDVEKTKSLVQALINELDENKCTETINKFFTDWNARLCFLQPTVRILEPLLCLRRNLLTETKTLLSSAREDVAGSINKRIDDEMGKLWIRSIQINREAGGLQQANLSIMKAEPYAPETLFIEKAKLLWQSGDQTKSLKLITEKINEIEVNGPIRSQDKSNRLLYSEAKFLQATYSAESMKICVEQNLLYFKQAIEGNKNSEKCLVHMAQYMEKMYAALPDNEKKAEGGYGILYEIMVYYARAMRAGNESMYQSMPRLLSIWFDFTSPEGENDTNNVAVQQMSSKMSELVSKCCEALPTYIFYSAFSQILSRICHPSQQVFDVLKTIVILLLEKYPHQSMWMLLPVLKSSYAMRAKRCRLILNDKRLSKREIVKFVDDFHSLAEKLIQLTTKEVTASEQVVSALVPKLPKIFEDPNFSTILLPFEKFMQVTLLNPSQEDDQSVVNPFPNQSIYICGIKEKVVVLRSQACPKKISFLCSDGKSYAVMMKPKDDLRHDFRLMEFNALLKRYLHLDPQARQRRLHIRTYAAIPFNEDCGLIEWLPNLNAFRTIIMAIYKSRQMGISDKELRGYMLPKDEKLDKKKEVFLKILIPRHPPVFHEWFTTQFSTPHNWYQARSSYVKTTAVMSMVGYILGLGDRHGENILFDETNGDTVHVDFNCLFNKGECFALPERVPFRLTQNMIHAMGPLGVEGLYRKCCEITLRVLQKEKRTLMSVLRPFVYDLNRLGRKTGNNIERTDPQAMENVNRIDERLQGYVKRRGANRMPLSTEGQVDFLINEATDINNLAVMYAGWGPYL